MSDKVILEENEDERRAKNDRRSFKSLYGNAIDDTQEIILGGDRRKMPERRLNNIRVETSEIVEEEFLEFLENYNNNK